MEEVAFLEVSVLHALLFDGDGDSLPHVKVHTQYIIIECIIIYTHIHIS